MKKEFLFPITLFFVFACSSLFVLLFAANIYENVVESSNSNFETGTSLAYITEKIRQNDSADNIYISEFDGHEALAIKESYEDKTYTTYIYEYDGLLKEIFIQDGIHASAKAGTTIMNISNFEMKDQGNGLLEFTCTSSDGFKDSVIIKTLTK